MQSLPKIKSTQQIEAFWHDKAQRLNLTPAQFDALKPAMIQSLSAGQQQYGAAFWHQPHLIEDIFRQNLLDFQGNL